MIIVSACLLGDCCKFNGSHNYNKAVADFVQDKAYLPFCPEELGGLDTPRPPAEIVGGTSLDVLRGRAKLITLNNRDVTKEFIAGAREGLALAKENGVHTAILKEQSPSCGVRRVYDGTFSGDKVPGCGICTALLVKAGIKVISDEELGK